MKHETRQEKSEGSSEEKRLEELSRQREETAEKLYWSRHDGSSKDRQKQLEQEWNGIRFEEARLKGEKPPTYLHDRRDDFVFTKRAAPDGNGHVVEAEGRVHDPESTMNWRRDTEIGRKRENAIRPTLSKGTGDDAGHLIKAEWGADPEGVNRGGVDPSNPNATRAEDRLNFGRQNREMNRGTYRDLEGRITREARSEPIDVKVKARTQATRFEGSREAWRSTTLSRDGQPVPHETSNVVAGNFSSEPQRAAEAKPEKTGDRETRKRCDNVRSLCAKREEKGAAKSKGSPSRN